MCRNFGCGERDSRAVYARVSCGHVLIDISGRCDDGQWHGTTHCQHQQQLHRVYCNRTLVRELSVRPARLYGQHLFFCQRRCTDDGAQPAPGRSPHTVPGARADRCLDVVLYVCRTERQHLLYMRDVCPLLQKDARVIHTITFMGGGGAVLVPHDDEDRGDLTRRKGLLGVETLDQSNLCQERDLSTPLVRRITNVAGGHLATAAAWHLHTHL